MNKKKIRADITDLMGSIVDITTADELKWCSEELSKEADARHEASKITYKIKGVIKDGNI